MMNNDKIIMTSSNQSNDYLNLFEACKNGDLKLVQKLIDKTKINFKLNNYYNYGNRKSTFLHFAAGFGRKDILQYLLSCGADPSNKDEGGLEPLHNACSFGHVDVVELLLANNVNVNCICSWGYTPLHEASSKGKIDVMIVLLQHDADINIRNIDGKLPIDIALDQTTRTVLTGEYRKNELLEASKCGNEEKLMQLCTPLNINSNANDGRRSTCLHLASGYNRVNIVKILLSRGANVHSRDKGFD
jgi:tankyrase